MEEKAKILLLGTYHWDRIIVLYGAGHCKILRSFIKDYSEFEFIDPLDYL